MTIGPIHHVAVIVRSIDESLPRYERLYGRRAYLPARETAPIRDQVRDLARREGVRDRRRIRLSPPPQPEQLRLVV